MYHRLDAGQDGKDVRIEAYHPQSYGVEERFRRTLRQEGPDCYK